MRDLTGQVFHCLTVMALDKTAAGAMWLCKCSCGKETYARTHDLVGERKKSCGHLRTEHNKLYAERRLKGKRKIALTCKAVRGSGLSIDESIDELWGLV